MLYFHQSSCISPQSSFGNMELATINPSVNNQLKVVEPAYQGIPAGMLRRMGKAVRIGVGAALPLIAANQKPDAIIIGTANGGLEDCILFLNQIVDFDEGLLAPGNFVQSTPNAVAAQLALMQANQAYNITHTHRGLSFENALLDAMMLTASQPELNCLLGAVDEISSYNFNIDQLDGWFKEEITSNLQLFESGTAGSIAGEGSVMFTVSGTRVHSAAGLKGLKMVHTCDEKILRSELDDFLKTHLGAGEKIDIFLSGENGDIRLKRFFDEMGAAMDADTVCLRFKHLCGEFATASGFATWISIAILGGTPIPAHMIARGKPSGNPRRILICNTHKEYQHSFILLSKPDASDDQVLA